MKKEEYTFRSTGNTAEIHVIEYQPDLEIKAILQISHGMCEFIDRYEPFANFLCKRGFLVVGNDHLGHGKSINKEDGLGYFTKENGYKVVVEDLHQLTKIIKEKYPDKPYFLLGHSMGSFMARNYLLDYSYELNGAIIMGTGFPGKLMCKMGMTICKLIAAFKGWHYRSQFVNNMAFGSYNKAFKPARTQFDWLSKNEENIDWYIKEPKCNFVFTLNGYYNLFGSIANLYDKKQLANINKNLPILFVSGDCDPVGENGKGVQRAYESLVDIGMHDLNIKLYPNDRHEILNELDRKIVYEDIYQWLIKKLKER